MKKDKSSLERKGRYMSKLLRHSPEDENLTLDDYGYVNVKDLCKALKLTTEELQSIVDTNNKKRFEYNSNKTKIRASQGHSIKIKHDFELVTPPPVLFHGTTTDNLNLIFKEGLKKMKRHHVHLTWDYMTAFDVGIRYAKQKHKVWVIAIDAKQMHENGFKFYRSQNLVYLVDNVPSKYFIKM